MTFDIEHWEMNKSGVERRGECIFTTTGAGYRAQEGMAMLVEKYRNIRETSFAAWKLPLCMKRKRYESMREALCINVWIWNTLKYSLGSAGLQLAQCARNCLNNSLNSAIRISAGPGWACSLYTLYAIELWRFFAEFSQCIEKATTWHHHDCVTSGQYVLFQHPIILSLDYDEPIWNSQVKYMDFEKLKK